jgi:transposase
MQDNAQVNTARKTLERQGVWVIEHLPHSSGLNPIEYLWWALKRAIY